MLRMFGFLLFVIFFPVQILAGVGDVDNRYYVTDEMWAQEPYKKFVHLELGEISYGYSETEGDFVEEFMKSGSCTAQYISRNLILSAGHCTDSNIDILYRATNYKHETFLVQLLENHYKHTHATGDWAVWLVTDPKYYNDSYFDILAPTQNISVINAGWGWVKILSNDTLDKIRQILSERSFLY